MSTVLPVGAIVQIVVYGEVISHDSSSIELKSGSLIDLDDIERITVVDDAGVSR